MWPKKKIELDETEAAREVRRRYQCASQGTEDAYPLQYTNVISTNDQDVNENGDGGIEPQRYSSWKRLTSVQAWIMRFVDNCRSYGKDKSRGELNVDEIGQAEIVLIKQCQIDSFKEEYKCLKAGKPLIKESKLLSESCD